MDTRVVKQAHIVVDYSANVQPGESVAILSTTLGAPLVEAIFERVLTRGGYPTTFITLPRLAEILLRTANDEQLRRPSLFFAIDGTERFDHIINILAPDNSRSAGSADPQRVAISQEGLRPHIPKWVEKMMRPDKAITITLHPTSGLAQDAGMSLLDYEDFVYRAYLLDEPDPIAAWQALGERQLRIRDWLQTRSMLHVQGPHIDLRLGIAGRGWISDDGHKNMPGGELFTSPLEDQVDGWVRFTYPATYNSREARGVQLWFEQGRVVKWEATTGLDYLTQMLNMDEAARRLGEFAIGTNYGVSKATGNVLFDEKIGGTCHLALGFGFPHVGSRNQSAIHWDMVCDLKTDSAITADGETFYQDGEFTI